MRELGSMLVAAPSKPPEAGDTCACFENAWVPRRCAHKDKTIETSTFPKVCHVSLSQQQTVCHAQNASKGEIRESKEACVGGYTRCSASHHPLIHVSTRMYGLQGAARKYEHKTTVTCYHHRALCLQQETVSESAAQRQRATKRELGGMWCDRMVRSGNL
jgi:hypothetical protein